MKTVFYILIALFMTASFTSCTAENINDDSNISAEQVATGEDGTVTGEDEG